MRSCPIKLSSAEAVKRFIGIITEQPYELYLVDGPRRVNAKSQMQVFSLNLTHPLELLLPDEEDGLIKRLSPYLYQSSDHGGTI